MELQQHDAAGVLSTPRAPACPEPRVGQPWSLQSAARLFAGRDGRWPACRPSRQKRREARCGCLQRPAPLRPLPARPQRLQRAPGGARQRMRASSSTEAEQTFDIASMARQRMSKGERSAPKPATGLQSFFSKVRAAWHIFFPTHNPATTAKDEGKNRLRMILVADRCGMNQSSMYEMRHSIVRAVSEFVDIEAEDQIEVNVSADPSMGTVYSVAVPIRRVKPTARVPVGVGTLDTDGVTLEWESEDGDADPSGRFPFGC